MKPVNPKVILPVSRIGKLMEVSCIAGLAFLWLYTIYSYSQLPEIIPVHYNFKGEIDNYGSKVTIFLVPTIMTIVVAGITLLNKHPHVFNYTRPITTQNAEEQYRMATNLLRYLKVVIIALGIYINLTMINDAKQGASSLGMWFLPVLLVLIIAPTIHYVIKATRKQ